MKYIYIGDVVNTHGLKGEVRLISNFEYKKRVFKKNFKLEYAKFRLEYSNDSIDKISDELNFSSREHFCYFFKKETNETPLSYRKKQKMD